MEYGIECVDCNFRNAELQYAGGKYRVENSTFSLPIRIVLTGPALNTANFPNTFGLLGCPSAQQQTPTTNPNAPKILNARFAPRGKVTLVNPTPVNR